MSDYIRPTNIIYWKDRAGGATILLGIFRGPNSIRKLFSIENNTTILNPIPSVPLSLQTCVFHCSHPLIQFYNLRNTCWEQTPSHFATSTTPLVFLFTSNLGFPTSTVPTFYRVGQGPVEDTEGPRDSPSFSVYSVPPPQVSNLGLVLSFHQESNRTCATSTELQFKDS